MQSRVWDKTVKAWWRGKDEKELEKKIVFFSYWRKKRIRRQYFYQSEQVCNELYFTLQNLVKPASKGQSIYSKNKLSAWQNSFSNTSISSFFSERWIWFSLRRNKHLYLSCYLLFFSGSIQFKPVTVSCSLLYSLNSEHVEQKDR